MNIGKSVGQKITDSTISLMRNILIKSSTDSISLPVKALITQLIRVDIWTKIGASVWDLIFSSMFKFIKNNT